MLQIQFFSLIRMLLKRDAIEIAWADGDTVQRVLEKTQRQITMPFLHKLVDEQGAPHAGTIILVNRKNILHLQGLQTPIADGDVLALFPPGAGG
ncbi:MAG: MoaD family protein [Desulfuromonadales bacterium]|nr:MoaD family protein [Desulfuromonadales bacterium]